MRRMMIVAALMGVAWSGSVAAQTLEGRVDRLEREVRAVQRKVFPGGNGLTIEPQITAPNEPAAPPPGSPASSAVTDLTARVASLESQLSSLVGQSEQNGYRVRQVEEAFNAYKKATDDRLRILESGGTGVGGPDAALVGGSTNTAVDRPPSGTAGRGQTAAKPVTAPAATRANPERVAAVGAVERPSTGDAAEDLYTYGYRLWTAKFYPEAQVQLKQVGEKYPRHRRASFAQNLLGRAYLDEGKPALASVALYDSYKKWPDGERAPDSLYYLGQALTRLKKPADACKVYDELLDVYGDRASATLKADVAKGRTTAKCA